MKHILVCFIIALLGAAGFLALVFAAAYAYTNHAHGIIFLI